MNERYRWISLDLYVREPRGSDVRWSSMAEDLNAAVSRREMDTTRHERGKVKRALRIAYSR